MAVGYLDSFACSGRKSSLSSNFCSCQWSSQEGVSFQWHIYLKQPNQGEVLGSDMLTIRGFFLIVKTALRRSYDHGWPSELAAFRRCSPCPYSGGNSSRLLAQSAISSPCPQVSFPDRQLYWMCQHCNPLEQAATPSEPISSQTATILQAEKAFSSWEHFGLSYFFGGAHLHHKLQVANMELYSPALCFLFFFNDFASDKFNNLTESLFQKVWWNSGFINRRHNVSDCIFYCKKHTQIYTYRHTHIGITIPEPLILTKL